MDTYSSYGVCAVKDRKIIYTSVILPACFIFLEPEEMSELHFVISCQQI